MEKVDAFFARKQRHLKNHIHASKRVIDELDPHVIDRLSLRPWGSSGTNPAAYEAPRSAAPK